MQRSFKTHIILILPNDCESYCNYDCSNSCRFRDMTCFMISFEFFRNFNLHNNLQNLNFATLELVAVRFSQRLRILPPVMTAQVLIVFVIWRLLWFLFNFSEVSIYKIICKTWNSQPCSWVLSENYQRSRILSPKMIAQVPVISET